MNFRLSYSNTVDLPIGLSIVGYLLIVLGLLGAAIYAIVAKGRIPSPTIHMLADPQTAGYTCNLTTIYPGQVFVTPTSTFAYTALSSIAYLGTNFSNCVTEDSSQVRVLGPPTSWPRWEWDWEVTCQTGDDDNPTNVSFSIMDLNHPNTAPYDGYALAIWNLTIEVLYQNLNAWSCDNQNVTGFTVMANNGMSLFQSGDSMEICDGTVDDVPGLSQILENINNGTLYDFSGVNNELSPLPGMAYPCTTTGLIWAPPTTIAIECYTIIAATFAPLYGAVLWVMKKLHSGKDTRGAGQLRPRVPQRDSNVDLATLYSETPYDEVASKPLFS